MLVASKQPLPLTQAIKLSQGYILTYDENVNPRRNISIASIITCYYQVYHKPLRIAYAELIAKGLWYKMINNGKLYGMK